MPAAALTDEESDRCPGAPHPRHTRQLVGLVGQEAALLEAYQRSRLPNAIILGGQAGIGKATLAWRLAKFLLDHPRPETWRSGGVTSLAITEGTASAGQVESLAHPDLVLLRREVNEKTKRFYTEIRADDVRRAIGLFQRAAGAGGYRICILDSADDLNRSSANALLKIIEEPPPLSLFILVAHRPGTILPTIRSRARLIRCDPLAPAEIVAIIKGLGSPVSDRDEDEIAAAADRARGSVGDAIRLLEGRGLEFQQTVARLLDRLPSIDWRETHKIADAAAGRDGEDVYKATLTAVFDWLADVVRSDNGDTPRRLAPYAEVWEKVAQSARETNALNLDKRPLILSIFSDLAAASRAAA